MLPSAEACFCLQGPAAASHQQSSRQQLLLDLTPASERPVGMLAGFTASEASMVLAQSPDSPAYRSGVDIDFLRQHDVQLM